jgi:hypothetical protein
MTPGLDYLFDERGGWSTKYDETWTDPDFGLQRGQGLYSGSMRIGSGVS